MPARTTRNPRFADCILHKTWRCFFWVQWQSAHWYVGRLAFSLPLSSPWTSTLFSLSLLPFKALCMHLTKQEQTYCTSKDSTLLLQGEWREEADWLAFRRHSLCLLFGLLFSQVQSPSYWPTVVSVMVRSSRPLAPLSKTTHINQHVLTRLLFCLLCTQLTNSHVIFENDVLLLKGEREWLWSGWHVFCHFLHACSFSIFQVPRRSKSCNYVSSRRRTLRPGELLLSLLPPTFNEATTFFVAALVSKNRFH